MDLPPCFGCLRDATRARNVDGVVGSGGMAVGRYAYRQPFDTERSSEVPSLALVAALAGPQAAVVVPADPVAADMIRAGGC
jgi:hypothetical protein